MKVNIKDILIGDTIVTKLKTTGTVISILSYAYLNDRYIRLQNQDSDQLLLDLMPFKFDDVKHKGLWYQSLIIAVKNELSYNKDQYSNKGTIYYLEGVDLGDIKRVIKPDSKLSIWQKIKQKVEHIFKQKAK